MMFTDLPCDLESEILSRVPATSLSQLRSTCKRWYTLFKDPRFIRKNFGKGATQVILKSNHSVYSVSINLKGINNSFDPSIVLTDKLRSIKDSKQVKVRDISHCRCLLLCTTEDNRPVVWNPCTGQTRWIQSGNGYARCHRYVLGYKHFCDSYKILKFSCYNHNDLTDPELYEFKSDSWRVLDDGTPNFSIVFDSVALKGNTYWFASDKEDYLIEFILRFYFTTERFERLSLPSQINEGNKTVTLLVVKEEKLALLYQDFGAALSMQMKIWMTNTKIDEAKDLSWSNFLVVDFDKLMIKSMWSVRSFLVDEENKMVVCCDRGRIYIAREDVHKQVYEESTKRSYGFSPLLVSCVPSLVQIQQGKSNPGGKRKSQKGD